MILILTHSSDATADFLCSRLTRENVSYLRLDTDTLASSVSLDFGRGEISLLGNGFRLTPNQINCLWLRRPQRIRITAEDSAEAAHCSSEWGEALEGFLSQVDKEKWINYPAHNASASHKIEQLIRARTFGLSPPETLVTQDNDAARSFVEKHGGTAVIKPLSGGYIERTSSRNDTQIYSSRVYTYQFDDPHLLARCPTLLQAEVPKSSDVRIVAIDDRLTAVELVRNDISGKQILDIRRDSMQGVSYRPISIPIQTADALQQLLRSYKLRFAAIDFAISDSGSWVFFEINPGGQWAWLDQVGASDLAGDLMWAMQKK
uniref:MvdC/MvdD family ATP grasp protein n=1 Tax=Corallococcus coralloides TaxID=184914 RepID=UPI000FFE3C49|nr:hypothetical protein [Corallococcus coralloides]